MHWVGFGASVYHLEGGGDASDNLSNFLNLKFKRRKSPIHKDILVLTLSQYSGSLKGILITRADLLWLFFADYCYWSNLLKLHLRRRSCVWFTDLKKEWKNSIFGKLNFLYTLLCWSNWTQKSSLKLRQLIKMSKSGKNVLEEEWSDCCLREISKALSIVNVFR